LENGDWTCKSPLSAIASFALSPGYEHKAVEAEATIGPGETPEDALLSGGLGDCAAARRRYHGPKTLRSEVNFLHHQRQELRGAVAGAEAEVRKLRNEIDQLLSRPALLNRSFLPTRFHEDPK
jgi:hypothetical protein